ncbi:phytanoyl-CoA dioxygenase family protein [Porticoccus sp.]
MHTDNLIRDGYSVFRSAISPSRITAARHHIHAAFAEAQVVEQTLLLPSLTNDPVLRDIAEQSEVSTLLSELTNGDILPPDHVYPILRLSELQRPAVVELAPHIDGTWNPLQEQTRHGDFFAFCAHLFVFLSDVPAPDYGAFHVWPGSHHRMAAYIKANGLSELKAAKDGGRHILSKLQLPQATPVTGRTGDVVLCHPLLAHSGSPNYSPEIRYGLVIRQRHRQYLVADQKPYAEPFSQWPGLAASALGNSST